MRHPAPARRRRWLRRLAAAVLALLAAPLVAGACTGRGIALQVLGSGGPVADSARAASGYLIWQDGRARVLVDAGGGTFLRYGESGARIEDLELVALTHLHTDHVADLPALLMGGYFSPRTAALPVLGPGGNARMPSTGEFLQALFAPGRGAYRYLAGFLDGSDGLFRLQPQEVDAESRQAKPVFTQAGLRVSAVGVRHGPIPTLGYLFELGETRIAISGDQNLEDDGFVRLARGADLMVMPMAIPGDAVPAARGLHATPAQIGTAAAAAQPAQLILTHLMRRSLRDLDTALADVARHYRGEVRLAADLACYTPPPAARPADPGVQRQRPGAAVP